MFKTSLSLFIIASISLLFLPINRAQRIIPVKDPKNILITFGSCNAYYGDEPADIFYRIIEQNSDVWIWLGDVAYVDEKVLPPIFAYAGKEKVQATFKKAKQRKEYSALRNSTQIIGVWDDHDYGINNGNRHFEHKDVVQQLWLDFLDEPLNSTRRKRPGIYESYYIGDETKIKVILLDVRYFKDARGEQEEMLGDAQWKWLEDELANNKAEFVIIGSGTQVLPDDRLIPEYWYAKSRERFISLIKKYNVNGVILISGDVHYAEILSYPCKNRVGYELYEFTSSGLTHHVSTHVPFANAFVKYLYPDTFSKKENRYLERNFGVLRFTFNEHPSLVFEARNYSGDIVLNLNISKEELTIDKKTFLEDKSCILDIDPTKRFLDKNIQNLINGEPFAYLVLLVLILLGLLLFKALRGVWKLLSILFGVPKKSKTE